VCLDGVEGGERGTVEMTNQTMLVVVSFLFAALAAAVLTPVAARLASAIGLVAPPRVDRWSARHTPMLGGLAIVLSVLACSVALVPDAWPFLAVVAAALAAFALGLVDDARGLRPTSKLVGQLIIGAGLASAGVRVEIIPWPPIAFVATVIWVVLIMNAVNLMDNMDGLAAGIVAIAATVLVVMTSNQAPWIAVVAAATAGSCLGFLLYNFAPARIYMGDAGSLSLGVILASLTLLLTNDAASNVGLAVLSPLVALGLPIFDTILVTVVRRLEGRPVSQGGRDHTSHRLASLGLSERVTVLLLYAVGAAMASLGLLASWFGLASLPIAALALVALVLFAIFLVEAPVANPRAAPARRHMLGSGRAFLRHGAQIALDGTLAGVALASAYLIRYESFGPSVSVPIFIATFSVVIPIQLGAFAVFGVYRVLWRFLSVTDIFVVMAATTAGTVVAAAVVMILPGDVSQSRAVFLIDGILLALLVATSRMFLVSMRQWFGLQGRSTGRSVLIVGANETGAMALRLLLRSAEPRYRLAGFLDDDPGKQRRRIGGVPILGRIADLAVVVRREKTEVVVLALEDDFDRERVVRLQCEELGLELRQLLPTL
jgi:UDP-GlcNAc:undecaprenyl-phosphate/decaprenyl-phosphate GlcNAc-1-phosphate transferase